MSGFLFQQFMYRVVLHIKDNIYIVLGRVTNSRLENVDSHGDLYCNLVFFLYCERSCMFIFCVTKL